MPDGVVTVSSCAECRQLNARFESAEKRYAQYSSTRSNRQAGVSVERARNIRREERANMTVLAQRLLDHKVACPLCKSDTAVHSHR